ncbi:MAG TPA: septal ring lytic transglycosylase RlpA family protein [Thermoanaerobaculia bacterium]
MAEVRWGLLCYLLSAICLLTLSCRTTAPLPPEAPTDPMHGVASWYGEEFAGRTTANGEIFDPQQLTAAHRTLPFGTVLEITNLKTKQSVRVRVNDRGPFIGGRIIDLSYGAAQQIGLIEPGIGEVDIKLVRLGNGEREPPVPFEATVAEVVPAPNRAPAPVPASDAPKVDVVPQDVVVDRIEVQTERAGVITRTQVAADGRTLEEVPAGVAPDAQPSAAKLDASAASRRERPAPRVQRGQYVVQVGAFSVEANAKLLQERLTAIGQRAWIDRNDLYRVRLGPFATRDQAVAARSSLEANGISAIIVAE